MTCRDFLQSEAIIAVNTTDNWNWSENTFNSLESKQNVTIAEHCDSVFGGKVTYSFKIINETLDKDVDYHSKCFKYFYCWKYQQLSGHYH